MDIQKFLYSISAAQREVRSQYHLTLGRLITALEQADDDLPVVLSDKPGESPGRAMSYRGYYADLSFAPSGEPITAVEFLNACKAALGATFEGYKGGDFIMGEDTPLWIAPYGNSDDRAIVDCEVREGAFHLVIRGAKAAA